MDGVDAAVFVQVGCKVLEVKDESMKSGCRYTRMHVSWTIV